MSTRDTTQTTIVFSAINLHSGDTKLDEKSGARHFKTEPRRYDDYIQNFH